MVTPPLPRAREASRIDAAPRDEAQPEPLAQTSTAFAANRSVPTAQIVKFRSGGMVEPLRHFLAVAGGRGIILLASALFFLLSALPGSAGEPAISKEYQLKAAFLFNFTKFVEWPATAFAGPSSPIVIGVLGADPFGGELAKAIEGRKVNGRDLLIKTLEKIDDAKSVHVLFISSPADKELSEYLAALKEKPVLTVGETQPFAKHGGIITFTLEADKVRFEINSDSAEEAGLKISAQLLKLAKTVQKKS